MTTETALSVKHSALRDVRSSTVAIGTASVFALAMACLGASIDAAPIAVPASIVHLRGTIAPTAQRADDADTLDAATAIARKRKPV